MHWARLHTFFHSNWIWKVNRSLQIRKNSTHQWIKMSRRESSCFLTGNFQNHQNSIIWNLVCYPSITDSVEAMNTLIQERHNHSEECITVKVSRRTQKLEIYLAKEGSGLAFFSTGLVHIFWSNTGNEFGVRLRGEGPHKPEFAYDFVSLHFLMNHTDRIEYNIVGNTKSPLLRYFPFFWNSRLETI